MGWISEMKRMYVEQVTKRKHATEAEQLQTKVAMHDVKLAEWCLERDAAETQLQAALMDGDEAAADRASAQLEQLQRQVREVELTLAGLRAKKAGVLRQAEAAAMAKRRAEARQCMAEMDADLTKIAVGCEMIAAGARAFNASRVRFYEVTPIAPEQVPPCWVHLERYIERHIGARSGLYRKAIAGHANQEALAKVNELLLHHRDVMNQLFPEDPQPKAA
jgi:hypothetical protein